MANDGLQGSPTKNVIILVVTVTGRGATPKVPQKTSVDNSEIDRRIFRQDGFQMIRFDQRGEPRLWAQDMMVGCLKNGTVG